MPKRKSIYLFIAFILMCFQVQFVWAQKARFILPENILYAEDSLQQVDTQDVNFLRYHPALNTYTFYTDLGNIASPALSNKISTSQTTGFRNGIDIYDHLRWNSSQQKMYQTTHPLTDIRYGQGGKEMLSLDVLHTQNIKPNWNVGIQYRRIRSDGHYSNQRTSVFNTRAFSWYSNNKESYHLLINANWNRINVRENGGIVSDSIFENISTGLIETNARLDDARNNVKENQYEVIQYFRLGASKFLNKYIISEKGDTTAKLYKFIPKYTVYHHSKVNTQIYNYNSANPDTPYYPLAYTNGDFSYDSIGFRTFENKIGISTAPFFRNREGDSIPGNTVADAYVRQQYITYTGIQSHAAYHNISVGFTLQNTLFSDKYQYKLNTEYFLSGYNQDNYSLQAELNYKIGMARLGARANSQQYSASFTEYFYYGNHFFWKNDFNQIRLNSAFVYLQSAQNRTEELSAGIVQYGNLVYMDSTAHPQQFSGQISAFVINADKTFRLGRCYFRPRLNYQVISNRSVLPLPEFSGMMSIYYKRALFKKHLVFMGGIDAYYNTAFFAKSYEPNTRQFFNQQQTLIGNYPWMDIYIGGFIGNFSMALKLEHASDGFFGRKYYSAPHYPIPPRVFRLVIAWKLMD